MTGYKQIAAVVVCAVLLAGCTAVSPTTEPTATQGPIGGAARDQSVAAHNARQLIANKLGIDVFSVRVVTAVPMDWPDSCLGIQPTGEFCAFHVVPGFLVVLEADSQVYECRTNGDGSQIEIVPRLELTWEPQEGCEQATLDYERGITFGACSGEMTSVPFAANIQLSHLARYGGDYGFFQAETAAGNLRFVGNGAETPDADTQRVMAEWAQTMVAEAAPAAQDFSLGVGIAWHREGGIAGFCDDVAIYLTGQVVPLSCKSQTPEAYGTSTLSSDQLVKLLTWVDTLAPFEFTQTDQATADVMTVRLVFGGKGCGEASQLDRDGIASFAADVYAQASGQ